MASVSTYLNFVRNTEEAFNFYKTVFGGEFQGNRIARFGDIPASPDYPPMKDEDKNLVMHVELRILNSHTIMGTDAPESMGFHVNFGNNSHINLQPDTRKETKELFDKLSAGGKVTMIKPAILIIPGKHSATIISMYLQIIILKLYWAFR